MKQTALLSAVQILTAALMLGMVLILPFCSNAEAHDLHGLTHEHASGFMFALVWIAAACVIYFIDLRADKRKA